MPKVLVPKVRSLPCLPSVAGSFVALAKKDSEGGSLCPRCVVEWVEGAVEGMVEGKESSFVGWALAHAVSN